MRFLPRRRYVPYLGFLALTLLPGCATVLDGTTQTVTVQTAPVGAACSVRQGVNVVRDVRSTPETLLVKRSQKDLLVICSKPGWEMSVTTIPAKFTGVTFGNVIVGGVPGVFIDAVSGADFRYDDESIIQLTPRLSERSVSGTISPQTLGAGPRRGYEPAS